MKAQTQATQRRRPWLIGCSIVSAVLVVSLVAAAVILYVKYVDFGKASSETDAAATAYRAAGMPWEAKDLKKAHFTPEQNAGPLIHEAIAKLGSKKISNDASAIQALVGKGSMEGALKAIGKYTPELNLVEAAVQKQYFDYGHDWDEGLSVLYPEMLSIRGFEKLLCLRARVEASQHRADLATKDLQTGWKLACLVGQEPILIGMLVDITCQRIVLDAIQRCAAECANDDAALAGFEKIIDKPADAPDIEWALKGEAYVGLSAVRNLVLLNKALERQQSDQSATPINKSSLIRTGVPSESKQRAFATRHFQVWTEAKAVLDQDRGKPAKLRLDLRKLCEKWSEIRGASYLLVAITFPVYADTTTAYVDTIADNVATRGLLEAFRVKAKTGKWPARIEEIPGNWIDPYTDKELLIKQTPDGFRIYSVGPNLKDDGGIRKQEIKDDAKKDEYDLVASFPPRKVKT